MIRSDHISARRIAMTISSAVAPQDIEVRVVPNDDIQIRVVAQKLPADQDASLKALIIYGAAAELGPSDHVPSYSPVDPQHREAAFQVDLREGEAFGGLLLVAGDVVWSAAFHRFKLAGGAVERCLFADRVCTLVVRDAPHASVVLLRRDMPHGPAGKPCYAYSVTAPDNALWEKTMLLDFTLSGSVADQTTLKAYRWSSAKGWKEVAGFKLSDDGSRFQVPVEVNFTYAISGG
jgi:hypothetical protein